MIILFVLLLSAFFFLGVSLFIARLVWSVLGIRNGSLRLIVYAVIVYAVWQHFQLPYEQTSRGWVATHWEQDSVGPAYPLGTRRSVAPMEPQAVPPASNTGATRGGSLPLSAPPLPMRSGRVDL